MRKDGQENRDNVARLLAKGLTQAQIVARTGLSQSAVSGHAKAIKDAQSLT